MQLIRQLFYTLLIKPALILALGFNARNLDRLRAGEAHLIAANHNSHLDGLVLMSLFDWHDIPKIKLVAAKDYFCRNKFTTWFSLNIFGIIPIDRKRAEDGDPLAPVLKALKEGYTVIIFPEGSRGEPEKLQPLKFGTAKLLELNPQIKVTPVFMYGLGKSLPRGESLFVPFICEINVGEDLAWTGDKASFMAALENSFAGLAAEIAPKSWQ